MGNLVFILDDDAFCMSLLAEIPVSSVTTLAFYSLMLMLCLRALGPWPASPGAWILELPKSVFAPRHVGYRISSDESDCGGINSSGGAGGELSPGPVPAKSARSAHLAGSNGSRKTVLILYP